MEDMERMSGKERRRWDIAMRERYAVHYSETMTEALEPESVVSGAPEDADG